MNFRERFDKFKKDRNVSMTKSELDKFSANEKEAIAIEAAAMREERSLRGEKHVSDARTRLAKAKESRSKYRPKGVKDTIGGIIWPKTSGSKGQKKGRGEIAEILWPSAKPSKHKAKKKDSIFDGLF